MARDLDELEDDNVTPEDLEGTDTGTCPVCFEVTYNGDVYCSEECANQDEENNED